MTVDGRSEMQREWRMRRDERKKERVTLSNDTRRTFRVALSLVRLNYSISVT